MSTALVTKEIQWDMGHRVPSHKSKCRNPHGHRYRLIVSFRGPIQPIRMQSSDGMVIDFGDIKRIMMEEVHDKFDHGFMCYEKDSLLPFLEQASHAAQADSAASEKYQIIKVPYIPTAENIATDIFKILTTAFAKEFGGNVTLVKVELYETPTSSAIIDRSF